MPFVSKLAFAIICFGVHSLPALGWIDHVWNRPSLGFERGAKAELCNHSASANGGWNVSPANLLASALLVSSSRSGQIGLRRPVRSPDRQAQHDVLKRRHNKPLMINVPNILGRRSSSSVLEKRTDRKGESIVIIGGGVSGIWAALTLAELGYTNITLIEKEARIGGKAAAFSYAGKTYPLGAVSTPLALESGSFSESSQVSLSANPGGFGASLLAGAGRRLQILNANHLVRGNSKWPEPFPAAELLSESPNEDWQYAFGAKGALERFYPHNIDFSSPAHAKLAENPERSVVPRWGSAQTSWPLVFVSGHGYGVAEAEDAPPLYYWNRFAQKSKSLVFLDKIPNIRRIATGGNPIGPRGPALRGWDSTTLFEKKLMAAGVKVRTGEPVVSVRRGPDDVEVQTMHGFVGVYDNLVLASDLRGALNYLDADAHERSLFSSILHQPYYTVASFIKLPWLAFGNVYYFGDNQSPILGRNRMDAGQATGGCPTILLKANKGSDLVLSWAYGGHGIGPLQIEDCLRNNVERLGGSFGGIYFIKEWPDYFPHPNLQQMRANFHKKLDALQGKRRMYMVGEVFNLPLVSECVDWARYLIRKHFRGNSNPNSPKGLAAEAFAR